MEENDTPTGSNAENARPFNGLTLDEFLAKTLDNPGEAVLRAFNMTPEQYRAAREKVSSPDAQEMNALE